MTPMVTSKNRAFDSYCAWYKGMGLYKYRAQGGPRQHNFTSKNSNSVFIFIYTASYVNNRGSPEFCLRFLSNSLRVLEIGMKSVADVISAPIGLSWLAYCTGGYSLASTTTFQDPPGPCSLISCVHWHRYDVTCRSLPSSMVHINSLAHWGNSTTTYAQYCGNNGYTPYLICLYIYKELYVLYWLTFFSKFKWALKIFSMKSSFEITP